MNRMLKLVTLSALMAGMLIAAEKSTVLSNLSVTASVGFESEYINQGKAAAGKSIQSSVEASAGLYKGSLTVGAWNNAPVTSTGVSNELDLYLGYKMPIYEKYVAEVGATYKWYTEPSAVDFSFEPYVGVTYTGCPFNPAIYVFYDVVLKQIAGEASSAYSIELAKYGLAKTSLDLGVYVGALSSRDTDGGQNAGEPNNGYTYYGATADLAYHFSKTASASIGVRYAGNNDGVVNDENTVTWGTKFSAAF